MVEFLLPWMTDLQNIGTKKFRSVLCEHRVFNGTCWAVMRERMCSRGWLLCQARCQQPQAQPAWQGSPRSKPKNIALAQKERKYQKHTEGHADGQEKRMPWCVMRVKYGPAEHDATSKRGGNRNGRNLHETFRSFTRVSIWKVCGNKSNRCTSAISYLFTGAMSVLGFRSLPSKTAKSRASVEGSQER